MGTASWPGSRVAAEEALRRNRELQRQFYGEPLGDRMRRLIVALGVSQATLSDTLGLSPPMLSQLMSGRRAKIGTPAVLARLVMLERRVSDPAVVRGEPGAVRAALREVRDAHPRVGVVEDAVPEQRGHEIAYGMLRTLAEPDELTRAADALHSGHPSLAEFLRRAAEAG